MAYVYICDFCRESEHLNCEEHTGSHGNPFAVGICVCSHSLRPEDRNDFEASVWEHYDDGPRANEL